MRHLPMIEFRTIPQNIDFSLYDGLIFTSKQGVIALDGISGGSWRDTPAAAIGKMTAKEIEKRGGKVLFVASKAYGEVLAKELSGRFKSFRWLYPRPRVVASKIASDLRSAGIEVEERVIYETLCREYPKSKKPEDGAVLIFTSPSIVKCFLKQFSWNESYRAVAIGKKTAEAFGGEVGCVVSPSQSIKDTIDFAKSLSQIQK
ncbi:uroporphyrinogen-III synthase [Hydrogenimonas sp.]|nr:uroporphyrinogen-III synthase [Hydrogenimonas sp.]